MKYLHHQDVNFNLTHIIQFNLKIFHLQKKLKIIKLLKYKEEYQLNKKY